MSRFRFLFGAALSLALILGATVPTALGHGGGHGGGGHGGYGHGGFGYGGYHHGFGYGGYHGYGYGYHGFGYGYGYPGFGFGLSGFGLGGFGLSGFGLYGLGGLGYGGLGYGGLGYGGLGYGGLGYGGLGYGGLGYGGLGMGGMMMGGMGMMGGMMGMRGGMMMGGGYGSGCNCCCLSAPPVSGNLVPVPAYGGGNAPANGGVNPPANGGGNSLPVPNKIGSRSPYVDYYARNTGSTPPAATASSNVPSRYVDYYARNSAPTEGNKARLHVTLPADAVLWLNGQRMNRTGTERDFLTPPLHKDETYAYQVTARWTQDGEPREETLEVKVRANKTTTVQLGASSLAKR